MDSFSIDPTLCVRTDPPAPRTLDQAVVTVPQHLAEASRNILIYLTQILEIPEASNDLDEGPVGETTFTAEELESLEPIDEEEFEPPIPSVIDGVCVNLNPQPDEIMDIIDLRRVGSDRQTYYLAKSIDGKYYWFHAPYAARGRHLRKLISDYRLKYHTETDSRKACDVKKLRSGRVRT
jgi:hypothetical protein